jgi:pyruvate dehydrogenase E1 component alpha subunit
MSARRDPRDRVQVLDEDGRVREGATVPDIDDESLVQMYREMRLARHFDARAVSLQRQGRIGTYPPLSGQEAAQVGSAMALSDGDWLFPSYREHAATHVRGVGLERTLRYWMGDERGNALDDVNVFPAAVPIATQVVHATGAAWAADLRGDAAAVLCYFGDGATSEGDFHEGLNFAGVFDVPAVFLCNNNQWAISVPRERQSASATLAQKAHAYGFEGVLVDGMDPLAVYQVTSEALSKAKDPDPVADDAPGRATRPTLVEAIQYRFGAHTTADDPSVYRDDDEVERWKRKDPIPRLEAYLREQGLLDDESVDTIEAEVETEVKAAIDAAERTERPVPADMFDHAYAERTRRLDEQATALERLRERYGDEELLE